MPAPPPPACPVQAPPGQRSLRRGPTIALPPATLSTQLPSLRVRVPAAQHSPPTPSFRDRETGPREGCAPACPAQHRRSDTFCCRGNWTEAPSPPTKPNPSPHPAFGLLMRLQESGTDWWRGRRERQWDGTGITFNTLGPPTAAPQGSAPHAKCLL